MSDDPREGVLVRLPIRVSHTEQGDGACSSNATVHCPVNQAARDLEHCIKCPRFHALSSDVAADPALYCHVPQDTVAPSTTVSEDWVARLSRTPVREFMTSRVTCLDSELGLTDAAQLLTNGHMHAAPVVEDQGVLIGMLSLADAVIEPSVNPERLIVDDVMTTEVVKLRESATANEALAMFARTGLHRLPVVSNTDQVVGIHSVIDLVRWLATFSKP